MGRADAPRDLLYGLLALQNGLIDQASLLAAFGAWTAAKDRPMADVLAAQGVLGPDHRALLDALADAHWRLHGGDPEKSLAAVRLAGPAREGLARLGDGRLDATLGLVGPEPGSTEDGEAERTGTYAVGAPTSDGQRFRVLRPHARGGLGVVHVALDSELNREVALKQILDRHADDPVSRQRFLLEAEITGGLEHPGVVPVYGLGQYPGGRPYYAMRFVRGESLKEAIARFHGRAPTSRRSRGRGDVDRPDGPSPGELSGGGAGRCGSRELELRLLLRRFLDVCNAIAYAHSRGVVHRDIKPSNILLGPFGETLVVDWGLAKVVGHDRPGTSPGREETLRPPSSSGTSETLAGTAVGTPAYMSPEQAEGRTDTAGPPADVYSLGATLYCVLTGRPPVVDDDVASALERVRRGDVPPARSVDRRVPAALEAVCAKAMARRAGDRYGSARALAEDVEHWLADEPVSARRDPPAERARRWLVRHRVSATAAAAAGLVAVVGLGAVLAVQARANRDLRAGNALLRRANDETNRANRALRETAEREARANDGLRAANGRAQRRFDLALEAARGFQARVTADVALREPRLVGLRRGLLGEVLAFYRRMQGALEGDPDPVARAGLAGAYAAAARITAEVGSAQDALAAYQQALAVYESLGPVAPGVGIRGRGGAAETLLGIADLLEQTGRVDEALASCRRALASYEALAADRPGEAEYAGGRASALARVGYLQARTGSLDAAIASYRQAVTLSEQAVRDAPEVERYRAGLARQLDQFGDRLDRAGRGAEARAAYRRALGLREALAAAHPGDPAFQRDLGASLHKVGLSHRMSGRGDEALPYYHRALAIRETLAVADPGVSADQSGLAETLFDLAVLRAQAGRPGEAEGLYRKALAIRERLHAENPDVTDFQITLAIALFGLGDLRAALGASAEALAMLRRSAGLAERASRAAPSVAMYVFVQALVLEAVARIERQSGAAGPAAESYRRVAALYDRLTAAEPGMVGHPWSLARVRLALAALELSAARPGPALAELDRAREALDRLPADDPLLRYELASGYSRLSSTPQDPAAARALASLRRLPPAGFRDGARLAADPAFAPLRGRPEFRDLLLDLAFPPDPFARP